MIPKYKFKPAVPRLLGYSGASESPRVGEVEWKYTDVMFQNCVGSPIAQLERSLEQKKSISGKRNPFQDFYFRKPCITTYPIQDPLNQSRDSPSPHAAMTQKDFPPISTKSKGALCLAYGSCLGNIGLELRENGSIEEGN